MSDDEKVEEKPFMAERAKTGRAKCKKCKCPIDKDVVRIAKLVANPFGDGKMKVWHHVACLFEVFAKQRATTKRINESEEDIAGWHDLCEEDKKIILQKIEEFEKNTPYKTPKVKKEASKSDTSPKKCKAAPSKDTGKKVKKIKQENAVSSSEDLTEDSKSNKDQKTTVSSRDDSFEEFQRVCENIARVDAYTDKTAVVRKMLTKGSAGDGFKSDIVLWVKMLLPAVMKRIYNLQSKQLLKLFSRIFVQDEDEMLEHLALGDVAETIRLFFEKSHVVKPASKSVLTIQEVDQFLEKLSFLTKEDEQTHHFCSIVSRCTCNDLRVIIRLIKHDLRINAGPKHILSAVHDDAYAAFQTSRDLVSVVKRCLQDTTSGQLSLSSSKSPSGNKVTLTLMTPVLPMLAEACKSVEMALRKCPHGMLSEVKYDGERVQVHKRGSEFRYFSRSLKPVLPHKVNLFKDYIPKAFPGGDDLILDSEVLVIDTKTGQPLPFGSLGIHKKAEFKDANVCLFVFDCIYYNGEVLLHKSMMHRRQILKEKMIEIPNRIMLSEIQEIHHPRELAEMIAKVLKMGLEGLVLKDVTGKYEPGKRHWLKVKKDYLFGGAMADSADLVVLGAWYGTGNKGGMMSVFLMGCYDEESGKWLTVTKVHTGHDDATLTLLQNELDMVKIGKDSNKVPSWLKANKPMVPDFVARDPKKQPVWEITGAEFTNQGVHTADGISIRFPRVTRIRDDKDWITATNLTELRKLFQKRSDSIDLSLLLPNDSKTRTSDGNESTKNSSTDETLVQENSESPSGKPKKPETLSPIVKQESNADKNMKKKKDKSPKLFADIKINEEPIEKDIGTKEEPKNELKVKRKRKTEEQLDVKRKKEIEDVKIEKDMENVKVKKQMEDVKTKEKLRDEAEVKSQKEKDEEGAKFYAIVDKDYIEYSATGTPLNWIDGREPLCSLPQDAKPLSKLSASELKNRTILKAAPVVLAPGFKHKQRQRLYRMLKTLGARILQKHERPIAMYVIHPNEEILATAIHEFEDVPKTARHVTATWVRATASGSTPQEPEVHAVQIAPDYCVCPCLHQQ